MTTKICTYTEPVRAIEDGDRDTSVLCEATVFNATFAPPRWSVRVAWDSGLAFFEGEPDCGAAAWALLPWDGTLCSLPRLAAPPRAARARSPPSAVAAAAAAAVVAVAAVDSVAEQHPVPALTAVDEVAPHPLVVARPRLWLAARAVVGSCAGIKCRVAVE